MSRKSKPKQLLKLLGDKTLLEATYHRLQKGFLPKEIFIATTSDYERHIRKQLPEIPKQNFSIEPEVRDRGPAVGLGALLINHAEPDSTFVMAWSDHYIKDVAGYFQSLKIAEAHLNDQPEKILTIGALPSSPHTGLRYIQVKKGGNSKKSEKVFNVKAFKDKPTHKQAENYLKSGDHLWNTGYFVAKTGHFLKFYEKHLPEIHKVLMQIKPYLGTKKQQWAINYFYPRMPKTDFEYILLKHPEVMACVKANFDWIDVGSWQVIKDVLSGEKDNLIKGLALHHKAEGSLIYNFEKKLVAITGLSDVVVINTKDALLIAPKNQSESVKELMNKMKADSNLKKYL